MVYSDDMILSAVLAFLAPFTTECMNGLREGVPGPRETTKTDAEVDMGILGFTLSSLMTLAKPVSAQNSPAYSKRWKAVSASVQMADIVAPETWTSIISLATLFQNIIAVRDDLRVEIVDKVISLEYTAK
ncbi:unnamed protein product [Parnassius apollo]|uniref:(apollo) hypothetical protein n=1 Tax=Parnassius apollo TaxID=110799 RepID=A0A8S3X6V2_PARAO|nr:unnamed protein product [Parnassius apollo]